MSFTTAVNLSGGVTFCFCIANKTMYIIGPYIIGPFTHEAQQRHTYETENEKREQFNST